MSATIEPLPKKSQEDTTSQTTSEPASTVEGLEGQEEDVQPEEEALPEGDPHRFNSEYFFDKHSPSFKCFEQYPCSASDLRMTLSFFDPLTDPGLEEALYYVAPDDPVDDTGAEKYKKLCKELEIVPITRIIKSLATDTLDLKYYGLTLLQMRALTEAMKINSNVKTLILQDNWMSPDAAILISDILRESNSLRTLNLQECRLGVEGIKNLAEGVSGTQFLQELNLSFNSLGDRGLRIILPSLIENTCIKVLDLSHNELTDESGETLGMLFTENKAIEEINLSWNAFCTGPCNKKIAKGLCKNELIRVLNLSWNGISTRPSALPLSRFIRRSETLQLIDLSFNRITKGSLNVIKAALNKSKAVVEAKMGYNIYTPDEAFLLGSVLATARNKLKTIDMEDMCVNKDFVPVAQRIRRMGKKVIHGKILSNYQIRGPDVNRLLFARCKYMAMKPKKKKQKKDFGHFILQLPEKPITKEEFQVTLKKKKVKKIDKDLLKELLTKYPGRRQKVDCAGMKEDYMKYYPDTVLPEPPKKKKKGKKGKKKKKKKGESSVHVIQKSATQVEGGEAGAEGQGEKAEGGDVEHGEKSMQKVTSKMTSSKGLLRDAMSKSHHEEIAKSKSKLDNPTLVSKSKIDNPTSVSKSKLENPKSVSQIH